MFYKKGSHKKKKPSKIPFSSHYHSEKTDLSSNTINIWYCRKVGIDILWNLEGNNLFQRFLSKMSATLNLKLPIFGSE